MPKYYLELYDGSELERDDEGEELRDEEDMRARAVEVAMELAVDQLPKDSCLTCTVRDAEDKTVATVKLTLTIS